jgi:hypothetical protein
MSMTALAVIRPYAVTCLCGWVCADGSNGAGRHHRHMQNRLRSDCDMLLSMAETYYKTLRLVPPGLANQIGIPAEAPAFLSPVIDTPRVCAMCLGCTYSPLVYQTGHVTAAHHYHAQSGGIYCFVATSLSFLASIAELTGFVAQVEPIGRMSRQAMRSTTVVRVQAVRTTQIMAYCMHRATSPRSRTTHHSSLIALEEGILQTRPPNTAPWRRLSADTYPGDLLPLCGPHELHPHEQAPFSFRIREGTVSYSLRPLP